MHICTYTCIKKQSLPHMWLSNSKANCFGLSKRNRVSFSLFKFLLLIASIYSLYRITSFIKIFSYTHIMNSDESHSLLPSIQTLPINFLLFLKTFPFYFNVCFTFLKWGLAVQFRLAWKSLCRIRWPPMLLQPSYLCLQSAGIVRVNHHVHLDNWLNSWVSCFQEVH